MLNTQLTPILSMRPDIPLTSSSVELAKLAQAAERAEATRRTGIQFRPDGTPYLPKVLRFVPLPVIAADVEVGVELAERMDAIVEEFGLALVKRYVVSVTAMNDQENQR